MPKGQPGTSRRYASMDPAGLATAAHSAEDREDDVALLAVMAEVEGRTAAEQQAFQHAYISQHGERAKLVAQRHGKR